MAGAGPNVPFLAGLSETVIHISDYKTYFILPLSEPCSLYTHSFPHLRRFQNNVSACSFAVTLKPHLTAQVTQGSLQVLSFYFTPQYFSYLSMSHYQILHSCRMTSMGMQELMERCQMVPMNRKVQS